MLAPALLALLALALAWPVPILLSGARWTRRSPAAALVLWQAIAIAGGLSMIGALLTFGLAPYGDNLFTGAVGFIESFPTPQPVEIVNVLALAGAGLLTAHLLLNLVITIVRSERQRHDVVLVLFRAWHESLPWFPIAYRAQREVGILIEMLADDNARRTVDDAVLADTIARVGAGRDGSLAGASDITDAATPDALSARVERLGPTARPLPRAAEAAIVAGAVTLLAVPTVLLLLPALLSLLAHA